MSDENIENNQEENQNNTFENKRKQQRNLDFKQKHILNIVLLILIVSIFTCGCKIQTNASSNIEPKNEEAEITLESINTKEMKISTPKECKQKGMHYIGKMKVRRFGAVVAEISKNELLIVGGLSQSGLERNNFGEAIYEKPFNKVECKYQLNAEIFDINTFETKLLNETPSNKILYSGQKLLNGDIIFPISMEIFRIKDRKFEKLNIKNNNDLYSDCISYNNEKIFCIYNNFQNRNYPTTILYDYIKSSNIINIPINDLFNQNNKKEKIGNILKTNDKSLVIYTYYKNTENEKNKISFYELNKGNKEFNYSFHVEIDGDYFKIFKISDSLLLINSSKNYKNHIYLYNFKNKEIINDYNFDKQYFLHQLGSGNFIIYNYYDKQLNIDYLFDLNTKQLILKNTKIKLPIVHSKLYSINENQLLFVGGCDRTTNRPTNSLYIYTF